MAASATCSRHLFLARSILKNSAEFFKFWASARTSAVHEIAPLNRVEAEYIRYYSEKYGDSLLNKQSVPKQTVKIEYKHQTQIETENQLRDRLSQKLGDKLKIKDDPMNKLLYYDVKIDGKRYRSVTKYKKQTKEEALTKITAKQQQLIGDLTIQWE